jgi:hypothetical protein
MPSFVHAPLLWGLALVGVPVLIHLIYMMRHRRVRWAAMEFLLVSQKKNRTWVLLKQLLLLTTRMAMVAAVVLLVAQPRLRGRLSDWFSGTTHHVVLLDDSFSMSDRWQQTSAFEEAKRVVQRIAEGVSAEGAHQFTLLRFSQAGRAARGTQPDLIQQTVDTDFPARLAELLAGLRVSQSAAGPMAALDGVEQLLQESAEEDRVVYLISDFRARSWDDATAMRQRLTDWTQSGVRLHLIRCVDASRPNLAIARLAPGEETRAAGVFFFMEVSVQNFGDTGVRDVAVLVETDGQAQPAVTIPTIPARGVEKARFPVRFVAAGPHRVTARLEADAVAADNTRFAVVDVPLNVPVLLIDGDAQAQDARYLSAVFEPGGAVTTGITPRIENPRYLSTHPLDPFGAIYLANVDRLDPSAVVALEQYVKAGGGVAFFLGERSQPEFINRELYRDGQGLFPVPVGRPTELYVDHLERAPDLEITGHPVFQVFAGQRNSFLPLVIVSRYMAVAKTWQPDPQGSAQVICRLRNGAPLAVERRWGKGRVVAFLTTAAPIWNNWARANPSFVVAMLRLHAYLAAQPAGDAGHLVEAPLELTLDPSRYAPQVRFTTPQEDTAPTATTEAVLNPQGQLVATLAATDQSGIYQARLARTDGREETRQWAVNVEADEGDLKAVLGPELAERLRDVPHKESSAAMFQYAAEDRSGTDLSLPLLYLLLGLLVAEQILAWSASYHPPSLRPGLAAGGSP